MLARPEMAWDNDPFRALLRTIYFSKEASSGGDTAIGVVAAVINPVTALN